MNPLLKHFDSFGSNKSDVYLRYHRAARAGPPSENRIFDQPMVESAANVSSIVTTNRIPLCSHLLPCLRLSWVATCHPPAPQSPAALNEMTSKMPLACCPRCRSCVLKIPEQPRTATQSGVSAGTRAGDAQAAAIWRLELLELSRGKGLTILAKH